MKIIADITQATQAIRARGITGLADHYQQPAVDAVSQFSSAINDAKASVDELFAERPEGILKTREQGYSDAVQDAQHALHELGRQPDTMRAYEAAFGTDHAALGSRWLADFNASLQYDYRWQNTDTTGAETMVLTPLPGADAPAQVTAASVEEAIQSAVEEYVIPNGIVVKPFDRADVYLVGIPFTDRHKYNIEMFQEAASLDDRIVGRILHQWPLQFSHLDYGLAARLEDEGVEALSIPERFTLFDQYTRSANHEMPQALAAAVAQLRTHDDPNAAATAWRATGGADFTVEGVTFTLTAPDAPGTVRVLTATSHAGALTEAAELRAAYRDTREMMHEDVLVIAKPYANRDIYVAGVPRVPEGTLRQPAVRYPSTWLARNDTAIGYVDHTGEPTAASTALTERLDREFERFSHYLSLAPEGSKELMRVTETLAATTRGLARTLDPQTQAGPSQILADASQTLSRNYDIMSGVKAGNVDGIRGFSDYPDYAELGQAQMDIEIARTLISGANS